jgi:hypothetical protein
MLQEVLAMHARPNQATVGINVNLGNAQFSCMPELCGVHAFCTSDIAASGVDARHLFLRHGA